MCDHYWQGQEVEVGWLVGFPTPLSALMKHSPGLITSWAFWFTCFNVSYPGTIYQLSWDYPPAHIMACLFHVFTPLSG